MKEYYPGNTYRTPPEKKASIWDFILFRTRLYFYLRVIRSILIYSRLAQKGLYTPELWARQSSEILEIAESCGARCEITGMENIRKVKDEPVIFAGNHMGLLETMILPSIIEPVKRVTFIIKSSLIDFPAFGKIMQATGPIIVGRKNPREDLMKVISEGLENLEKNISIVIFPQSTRQHFFDPGKFNSLGTKLAQRAKVKVVPFALKTDFIDQGKVIKDFGKLNRNKTVYIKFGEPVTIEGNGKAGHEKVIEFISRNLRQWGVEVK